MTRSRCEKKNGRETWTKNRDGSCLFSITDVVLASDWGAAFGTSIDTGAKVVAAFWAEAGERRGDGNAAAKQGEGGEEGGEDQEPGGDDQSVVGRKTRVVGKEFEAGEMVEVSGAELEAGPVSKIRRRIAE